MKNFVLFCIFGAFICRSNFKQQKTAAAAAKQITYFDNPEENSISQLYNWTEHSRSGIACPNNFYIGKMKAYFVVENTELHKNDMQEFIWPFTSQFAGKSEFKVNIRQEDNDHSCEFLSLCLGYQACLWKTSVGICANNPEPTQKKVLHTRVTCVRDTSSDKKDKIIYLSATSGSSTSTTIKQTIVPEEDVFNVSCPSAKNAHQHGFAGECKNNPPQKIQVVDHLWTILARNQDSHCREELREVYCAYQYNSTGGCIPPKLLELSLRGSERPASHLQYSFLSLPTPGSRPDMTKHHQIINDPHANLIPAKLGFIILVHKEPEIVMQLLRNIYRNFFYYVIHVDQRKISTRNTIAKMAESEFPKRNIHVLPTIRSFITSWGSYQIVRAELECFEELLRMGPWDFVINLSGVDLPLKSVDDMAASLASVRGTNFFKNHVNGRWKERTRSYKRKFNTVWHSCGDHVYNVSLRDIPKYADMYSASQWAICSREFAELVVAEDRGQLLNQMQFYAQTSLVPDESYLKSYLMMSNLSHTFRPGNLHTFSPFEGREENGLCKHTDDIDFCGQSPREYKLSDIPEIKHRSTAMFARKFDSNLNSSVRNEIIKWATRGYKVEQRKFLNTGFVRNIVHLAIKELHGSFWRKRVKIIKVPIIRILPELIHDDPCCEDLFIAPSSTLLHKKRYWIDIIVYDKKSRKKEKIRASLKTLLGPSCFSQGDLLAIRAFGRAPRYSEYDPAMPYYLTGSNRLTLRMVFSVVKHIKKTGACNETRKQTELEEELSRFTNIWNFTQEFTYVKVKTSNIPILGKKKYFNIWVIDPQGNIKCKEIFSIYETFLKPASGFFHDYYEIFTVHCKFVKAGLWKIIIAELEAKNPYPYITKFYLVDKKSYREDDRDNLYGLWKVEDVTTIVTEDDTNEYSVKKFISSEENEHEKMKRLEKDDKNGNKKPRTVDDKYRENFVEKNGGKYVDIHLNHENHKHEKKSILNALKKNIDPLLNQKYNSGIINNSRDSGRKGLVMSEHLQLWKREITKNKKIENMQYKRKYKKNGYGLFLNRLSRKEGLFVTGWKILLIVIAAAFLLKWVTAPFRTKKMDVQKLQTFFAAVVTIAILQITILLLF